VIEGRLEDGRIIEGALDSAETEVSRAKRPRFRSDAGRVVYGGGGIVPDFLVPEDSMSTIEQDFLRSIAAKGPQLQSVLQQYSLELHDKVARDFIILPEWRSELRRRVRAVGIVIDARFDSVATELLGNELDHRVARRAFGEAEAKKRMLHDDRALSRAIELLRKSRSQQDLLRTAAAAAAQHPTG
jgi:carboxyl-terminal processing protease